jgi:L-ascorbate peroxidase
MIFHTLFRIVSLALICGRVARTKGTESLQGAHATTVEETAKNGSISSAIMNATALAEYMNSIAFAEYVEWSSQTFEECRVWTKEFIAYSLVKGDEFSRIAAVKSIELYGRSMELYEYVLHESEEPIKYFNIFWHHPWAKYAAFVFITALMYLILRAHKKKMRLPMKMEALKNCHRDLSKFIREKSCNPILLRLAWSDAATYDRSIRKWPQCGGCNGSIHLPWEYSHPSNKGLRVGAIKVLERFKAKYPLVSWADLIQMSGALAVELCGGPNIINKLVWGRIDAREAETEYILACKTPIHSNKAKSLTGAKGPGLRKANADRASSEPGESDSLMLQFAESRRLPVSCPPFLGGAPTAEVHIRTTFYRMGFTNREIVALCGAHTIGRAYNDRSNVTPYPTGKGTQYTSNTWDPKEGAPVNFESMSQCPFSPGGASWTKNWLQFDNSYYQHYMKMYSAEKQDSSKAVKGTPINAVKKDVEFVPSTSKDKERGSALSDLKGPRRSTIKQPQVDPKEPQAEKNILHELNRSENDTELLWLPTDRALFEAAEFHKYFEMYEHDNSLFLSDYVEAHRKMSELGAKFDPPEGLHIKF